MSYKVLISDSLSKNAVKIFEARGIEVSYRPEIGQQRDILTKEIGEFDGLAIRSATILDKKVLEKAKNLKVIGRAGIGIDNIDLEFASTKGIAVMNTPFGNAITTAEHTIALIFSAARQIPAADSSTRSGKWEKNKFVGMELSGKKLGLIGVGNIGSVVAIRAQALGMEILAYDPFLSEERATNLKLTKIPELDQLLIQSDIVSLHLPKNEKTEKFLSKSKISMMKRGSILVNCARGGLVDEEAVAEAIRKGILSAAAFDVFLDEPATQSPLFDLPNVICTPHLGASTNEAQEKVSLQIAEQISNYLLDGSVENALNAPSMNAKEAPILEPWIKLAKVLGSFVGQMTDSAITEIEIEYVGMVGKLNIFPITSALVAELLRPLVGSGVVNMVSAPHIARQRGMKISEIRRDAQGAFGSYIRLIVNSENLQRSVAGTIYSDGKPRFIQIKGINLEAEPASHMLYTTNKDIPGYIGALGTVLGEAQVNIATFALGRDTKNGKAIALLGVDEAVGNSIIKKIENLPQVAKARALKFPQK